MVEQENCPVCLWPTTASRICLQCHWRRPGPAGDDAAQRLAETRDPAQYHLAAAQYRLDHRAAELAAAGDDVLRTMLLGRARGRPRSRPAVEQQGAPGPVDQPPAPAVTDLLRRLVQGHLDQLVFACFHPDAMSTVRVETDPLGTPRPARPTTWRWRDLWGPDAPDSATVRFRLAGGVGRSAHPAPAELRDLLVARLPTLDLAARTDLVLVPAAPQWWVLLFLAEAVAARHRNAVWSRTAVAADPVAEVARLLRYAPLRYGYDLLLAGTEADGTIRPVPIPLFSAGAAVNGGPRTARVQAFVPAGRTGPIALPVVVRHGEQPPDWTPVTIVHATLPDGVRTGLEVQLDAPARVRFPDLAVVGEDDGSLAELLGQLPERAPSERLDLVCAVELSGSDDHAEARLRLATATLDLLAARPQPPGQVRAGFVAYYQHLPRGGPLDPDRPVHLVDFAEPAQTRVAAERCRPRPNRNDLSAAAEDMLHSVAGLAWRPDTRRVLVVVGSRSPYPSRHEAGRRAHPCPSRRDWRADLRRLREHPGVETVAVRHEPHPYAHPTRIPSQARVDGFWRAIGAGGRFTLPGVTAAELVDRVAASPPELQQLPLALAVPGGLTRTPERQQR